MDAKLGFCWRCNGKIRSKIVECKSCLTAEYCSEECASDDGGRHESVECRLWSPQKCGGCIRTGVSRRCSGCYTIRYCNTECQRKHWKHHKPVCKLWQKIAIRAALHKKEPLEDLPYYFGNSFAKDLLNLRGNEMKTSADGVTNSPSKLNILLAASGDLKHAIKTVESLPSEFTGTLLFVMNDIDPFVTARNVLILFMLSTFKPDKASNIASIYLSLRLSKEDYCILQEALSALIQINPNQLKEETGGVIEFQEGLFDGLREVWIVWSILPCLREEANCLKLDEERQQFFERNWLRFSLKRIPKRHVSSIEEWSRNGVIYPSDFANCTLPYYNPTFTGRSHDRFVSPLAKSPASWTFAYCVHPDCAAFQVWDYLDLIRHHDLDSVTEMCHDFTTYCFTENMTLVKDRLVSYKIMTKDFAKLDVALLKNVPCGFDRIYTSNLIDYHKISEVIGPLESLLNKENPYSVLCTETFNWYGGITGAVEPNDSHGMLTLQSAATRDLNWQPFEFIGQNLNVLHEYYDNTDFFTCYIRGSRLAESGRPLSKLYLSKWSEFTECNGLRMHDIRSGRNSVLPYRLRVNARSVNMLRGDVRTLEWSRIPASN